MFVSISSFAVQGIEAEPVVVEVDVSPGIPAFEIVGQIDTSVREARERVRAAVRNSGFQFPPQRITVNLAPAQTRKSGPGFDLAIALGILAATGAVDPSGLNGLAAVGELALDGSLRPVRGALVMALAAQQGNFGPLVLPADNGSEAAQAGANVFVARHLADVVRFLRGESGLEGVRTEMAEGIPEPTTDLADVKGQLIARRALEVAAAGGHNLLMIGDAIRTLSCNFIMVRDADLSQYRSLFRL